MDSKFETERIDTYVTLFSAIQQRVGDDETARVILEQLGKDRRGVAMHERERSNGNGDTDVPATPKQLDYLEKLGVEFPAFVSKKAASALIEEALSKSA